MFLRLRIGFFPSGLTVLFTGFFLTALCCILFPLIDFVVCLTEDFPSNFPPEKGCGPDRWGGTGPVGVWAAEGEVLTAQRYGACEQVWGWSTEGRW